MSNEKGALRAILRLKSGLSPLERVEDLTVDVDRHKSYLRSLLDDASANGRSLGVVLGPYGSGKTHFLQLAKNYAFGQRYAVAQLGLDTGLGSLSHPQRHISTVLVSLSAPPPFGSVLEWLGSFADEDANTTTIELYFRGLMGRDAGINEVATNSLFILRQTPQQFRSTKLIEYLSGAPLVGCGAYVRARSNAYNLLRFWTKFCTELLDCSGLLFLIDEMESLFSNAVCWTVLSRRTAYRSLAYYACSIKSAALLCTFTPDGWNLLQAEIREKNDFFNNYWSRMEAEDLPRLLRILSKTQPHELSELDNRGYITLCNKLKCLHAEARGYANEGVNGSQLIPRTFIGMTPRIFSKSVISTLEGLWFSENIA
jgi:hypothetical protein